MRAASVSAFPRTRQRAAWFGAGVLAVFEHLHAVDEDVLHAGGVLVRLLEGGVVGDRRGVEDDHVSEHAFLEEAAMVEAEIAGGQGAETSHSFGERERF